MPYPSGCLFGNVPFQHIIHSKTLRSLLPVGSVFCKTPFPVLQTSDFYAQLHITHNSSLITHNVLRFADETGLVTDEAGWEDFFPSL